MFVDSTNVKAENKQRGMPVHLVVIVALVSEVHRRPMIDKRLVSLYVRTINILRSRLVALPVERIVHDSDIDLSGCALHVQRCRWHLEHQMKHYLWEDGISPMR